MTWVASAGSSWPRRTASPTRTDTDARRPSASAATVTAWRASTTPTYPVGRPGRPGGRGEGGGGEWAGAFCGRRRAAGRRQERCQEEKEPAEQRRRQPENVTARRGDRRFWGIERGASDHRGVL